MFIFARSILFLTGCLKTETAFKGGLSDIVLVVHLTNIRTVEELAEKRKKILEDISQTLRKEKLRGYKEISQDEFRLGIRLLADSQKFEVDIYPTVCSPTNSEPRKDYKILKKEPMSISEQFSPYFAKLQNDFVMNAPKNIKPLMQLVNYWSHKMCKNESYRLPPYLLNLIVIYTWEEDGSLKKFKIFNGFIVVLQTIVDYKSIARVWDKNYPLSDVEKFECPYLIDPANPKKNWLEKEMEKHLVYTRKIAEETLNSPLMKSVKINN